MCLRRTTLDEEQVIKLLWKSMRSGNEDPYDDDVAWSQNIPKRLLVSKCDMLVSFTDVPPTMTPSQMANKSIVSAVSDLIAKGVKPAYCMISIGLPKKYSTKNFVKGLASGFRSASIKYGFKILGGDTNATSSDIVIDVLLFGYADRIVPRSGARPGDIIAASGDFGLQAAGLKLLLGTATSTSEFRARATRSVLEPKARTDLRKIVSIYFGSCIDSSDGLALSLYHLAESSNVNIELDTVPLADGVNEFAAKNSLHPQELGLFGGEEYELIGTIDPRHEKAVRRVGGKIIGKVTSRTNKRSKPLVTLGSKKIPRRGWLHFQSQR